VRVLAAQAHVGGEVQLRCLAARRLDRLLEPLVHLAARPHDQVRVGDRLDVARAQLVVVRVGVGIEQPGHGHPVAADVAGQVGGLRGGGDHLERGTAAPGVVLPASGHERGDHDGGDGEKTGHRPPHVIETHSHSQ
jgi:hypothetical protein